MTHIPEEKLTDTVRGALTDYHDTSTVEGSGRVRVRGHRYADMAVRDRPDGKQQIAVEVENGKGEYRNGLGQASHYRAAGYVPVLALPVVRNDLADPDTDSGEALNACANADVGLLGIFLGECEGDNEETVTGAGYVLRPANY